LIKRSEDSAVSSILALLIGAAVIVVLYFARQVLVPFALAVLFAFLLSPVVNLLERWRLPRVLAIGLVLVVSCAAIGAVVWMVTDQLVDVMNQLPHYKANIASKIQSIRPMQGGSFSRVTTTLADITKQLSMPAKHAAPVPVEIVTSSSIAAIRDLLGPLFGRLATSAIVIVFTFFMLLKREDLRHRLFGLVGQTQIRPVTEALDDASSRVSRYLLMQLITNSMFAILVALGLYWIGIPNALVWGALAGLLRFVPYVGVWIAAAMPVLLALAVFDGWAHSLEAFGLFLILELTVSNFFEPWLYGAHTGISSLAILVAAVFWAILWGPIGLFLSTPLTVCLVVLGRHIPHLEFLSVLMGDEKPG